MTKKFLITLLTVVSFAFLASNSVYALIKIDINGNVIQVTPAVLGDEDEQKEEEHNEKSSQEVDEEKSPTLESTRSEENINQTKQENEAQKKEVERVREELKKNAEQAKKIKETNREILKKIEEKAKEEKQKNIERIMLQNKSSMRISVASKSGEIENIEDDEVMMETEHGMVGFRNSKSDDSTEIIHGKLTAHTDLPLNIDPKTKRMSVQSEGKELEIKVLPEEVLNSLSNERILNASSTGAPDKFEIVVEDGKVVYLVNDTKDEKLLGLFAVSIPKEIKVSGETGETLESKQTILSKILDFLSI